MLGRMLHWRRVWKAAKDRERERPKLKLKGHEREFLPAALEVLDTPSSPVARVVALIIALLVVAALAWGLLGHMDTVAVAEGRIIPGGHVKVIQPLEIGVVRAIHVRDGQKVKQGDLLMELDPTASKADRDRLKRELMATRLDAARLIAMATNRGDPLTGFRRPPGVDRALFASARALLRARLAEHRAKVAALGAEILKQHANRRAIAANADKLTQSIPLLAERVKGRERLARRKYGTRVAFLELKQELVEMRGDLRVARHQLEEINQAIKTSIQRRAELEASFGVLAHEELSKALQKISALREELRKAEDRNRHKSLRAPVGGTVQQLSVHTIGGVVNPADRVMVIVPENSKLEIEANVLNKDIGFVEARQEAVIKVESFPFTKYGTIAGTVVHVSADSIHDKEKGLVYAARVSMKDNKILVQDRWVALAPGMTVTVEVKTGKRRLIEFFLSPFLRYRDESLRER